MDDLRKDHKNSALQKLVRDKRKSLNDLYYHEKAINSAAEAKISVSYSKIMQGIRIWTSELSKNEFWPDFLKFVVIHDGISPFWTIFGLGKYLFSVSYSKIMQGIRIWPSKLSKNEFWPDFLKLVVIHDGNSPFWAVFGLVIY